MPFNASLIAYAFVKKGIDEGKYVTQMKLQKMLFFAQGYHLSRFGVPLIKETFQAWKYGPVVPNIYQDFKLYGSSPITDTNYLSFSRGFLEVATLDAKAQDAIDYTWEITKNTTASSLSNWTHQPGTPWDKVYNPIETDKVIDNGLIKSYFDSFLKIDF